MESINTWTHQWAQKNNISSHYKDTLPSTNSSAKEEYTGGFSIFLADEQIKGRGRGDNTWSQSSTGHTLLSTWCFEGPAPQPVFTARLGLALYTSLTTVWPNLAFSLKAPNDIYLDKGKMAGLLVEVSPQKDKCFFFIGLGLNVFSSPSIETQETNYLNKNDNVTLETWELFTGHFYNQLLSLQATSEQKQLSTKEQQQLLSAMNNYPENTYKDVAADGSLKVNDQQWIHWTEL